MPGAGPFGMPPTVELDGVVAGKPGLAMFTPGGFEICVPVAIPFDGVFVDNDDDDVDDVPHVGLLPLIDDVSPTWEIAGLRSVGTSGFGGGAASVVPAVVVAFGRTRSPSGIPRAMGSANSPAATRATE